MIMIIRTTSVLPLLMLLPGQAAAHPGHAAMDLVHLLTEPDHLAALLLPLVIGRVWLWRRYLLRNKFRRR